MQCGAAGAESMARRAQHADAHAHAVHAVVLLQAKSPGLCSACLRRSQQTGPRGWRRRRCQVSRRLWWRARVQVGGGRRPGCCARSSGRGRPGQLPLPAPHVSNGGLQPRAPSPLQRASPSTLPPPLPSPLPPAMQASHAPRMACPLGAASSCQMNTRPRRRATRRSRRSSRSSGSSSRPSPWRGRPGAKTVRAGSWQLCRLLNALPAVSGATTRASGAARMGLLLTAGCWLWHAALAWSPS